MKSQRISISPGNSKLGFIPSVSLPPGVSCKCGVSCLNYCYAAKLCRIHPTVKKAYHRNWEILQKDFESYWSQINEAVKMSRFFRFHVSGDIPDFGYFSELVKTARNNPHCEILIFTKQYETVNDWLKIQEHFKTGNVLPKNLHIIFSVLPDLELINPHDFPTAHIRFKDGNTTAPDTAVECGGNCTTCTLTGCGCWNLKNGQSVVFNQH